MFYNVCQFLGKSFTLLIFLKLDIKTDIMNCWAVHFTLCNLCNLINFQKEKSKMRKSSDVT